MGSIQKKRPTAVTVIGWIFIAGAILMIFSGGMGFMAFSFMQHMGGEAAPPIPEDAPFQFGVMEVIFQHFGLIALVQIALAAFILIASIQFLRLRRWARTALEVIAWLGLVYFVGFGIFFVASWIAMTSNIPFSEGASGPSPMFGIFGAVMGFVVTLFWAVPLVVIIIFLRGKIIRGAVS
ncbi:MAG: hypothetical protein JXA50_11050 [Deltaproteobacteria bacterium]|nr:hypothetical protein [Deltaproteobacteria bacterium]